MPQDSSLAPPLDPQSSITIIPRDQLGGDDLCNATVPASIRQPSRKKKGFKWGPRDSMKTRNFVGKPGTKRHQRHLNRTFLTDRADEIDDQDWFVPESYVSPFSLFSDEENRKAWNAFLDASEDQQEELLMWFENFKVSDQQQKIAKAKTAYQTAQDSYNRIEKQARNSLRRQRESEFLTTLDIEILTYVNGTEKLLVYNFEESSRRMMCHGVCQYYSLTSRSVTNKNGTRTTLVYKPDTIAVPTLSLTQFLNSL